MNDESGWLVQHDEIVILMQNLQRDFFGRCLEFFNLRLTHEDDVPASHGFTIAWLLSVEEHVTLADQALQPHP